MLKNKLFNKILSCAEQALLQDETNSGGVIPFSVILRYFLMPQKVTKNGLTIIRHSAHETAYAKFKRTPPIGFVWTELSRRRSHAAKQVKSPIWLFPSVMRASPFA